MPELPDVSVYLERLTAKIVGHRLERVRIGHPFLLRSVTPPIAAVEGKLVVGVERLGKRVVIAFEGELFLVVHLMIAGRLRWLAPGKKTAPNALAFFEFDSRHARPHRGRQAAARVAARGRRDAPRSRRSTPAAST